MAISPTLQAALQTAITNWHHAKRTYEQTGRAFADAESQMQIAERDLHELARAIEVATGDTAPIGATITVPVVPGGGEVAVTPAPSPDGVDAAAIVLEEMQKMRMGLP